jgi:hypothetical protein
VKDSSTINQTIATPAILQTLASIACRDCALCPYVSTLILEYGYLFEFRKSSSMLAFNKTEPYGHDEENSG